jgi:hypothetical protein
MDVCQGYKMINAYLYSVKQEDCAADKWDYGLLKEIFDKNNIEQTKVVELPNTKKAFVVIPGPQNIGHEQKINEELKKIKKVVLFITGDEEGIFNINAINHNNIDIWIQYPHEKHKKYNKLPVGVPQHLKQNLPEYTDKQYDVYFGGQITHVRRAQLSEIMPTLKNSLYKPTNGFSQGDTPKEYYKNLISAKICPAPAGAVVIDTFRFYEILEMLSIPIADNKNSKNVYTDFYKQLFEEDMPIKTVLDWYELGGIIPKLLEEYPNNMHKAVAWWIKYKRDLSIKIMGQINAKK